METAELTAQKCRKCSAELDTSGYPKWCKACRAKYKREAEDAKEQRVESLEEELATLRKSVDGAYERGVQDGRELAARAIGNLGNRYAATVEMAKIARGL